MLVRDTPVDLNAGTIAVQYPAHAGLADPLLGYPLYEWRPRIPSLS